MLVSNKRMMRTAIAGIALLTSLAVVGVPMMSAAAAQPQPFQLYSSGWSTSWTYNGYAPNYAFTSMPMYVDLPLALLIQPSGRYVPELAQSWKIVGNQLRIMLQPGAKWQNGAPVTSQDVVDTYLLGATVGWPWLNVATSVQAPNNREVVFQLRPHVSGTTAPVPAQTVLLSVLNNFVFPSSVYGKLVTPKLKSEVETYATTVPATAGTPPSSVNTQAHDYLIQAGQSLLAFNPPTLVGDGPFQLQGMTSEQKNLVRWPGYFGASKIHVPQIVAWNDTSNTLATTQMFAGKMDYGWPSENSGIIKRWEAEANHHYTTVPTTGGEAFYFNDRSYPLNIVKVRQALAYLVNRRSLTIAESGFLKNTVNTYPTGLPHTLRMLYIGSDATMKKLGFNSYAYNPARARQILISLHFTNRNGKWYTPKGQPFTISIISPGGWSGTQISSNNLASQLTAFGIQTTASAVEQPGIWTQVLQGNFQMTWDWYGFFNPFPINSLQSTLLYQNYGPPTTAAPVPGTTPTVGMGFGPKVNIPGIGSTNLAESLMAAGYVSDPAKIHQLVLDYAKLVNEDIPFLPFDTKASETFWSTANYTDWPSLSNKTLWGAAGANPPAALLMMMMQGYIRPVG